MSDERLRQRAPRRPAPPRASGPVRAALRRERVAERPEPWAQLRSAAYTPHIYRRMVESVSARAQPGEVVGVYDRDGRRFGSAFFNPRSQICLRMVAFDDAEVDTPFYERLIDRAVTLRRDLGLGRPETESDTDTDTDAYRVFNSEGDGLSGLIVDRFADVLSVEVYSLGVFRLLERLLPLFHARCGTQRALVQVDDRVAELEGIGAPAPASAEASPVRIVENGVRFAIDFAGGHKTGFFCDQRENRARFARLATGRAVLDLCCYTGGFSLYANTLGGASESTGVDLDEKAIAQAKRNANLNRSRWGSAQARWVHADAFSYARQMQQNERRWGAVSVDPPKFIATRQAFEEGRKKYFDLNRLALGLVEAGGFFVTSSCSGLMPQREFERLVVEAAHSRRRGLQLLWATGAAADHPVATNFPEGRYLKTLFFRVPG